jgi:hypothetical protein
MSSIPPPSPGQPGAEEPERAKPERPDPARAGAPRRPRYLVVALIAALVFGAGCWTEGCGRLTFYRGEHNSVSLNASIKDDADRAHADSLYQRFIDLADSSRGRAIPMAAATFVLGAALLALAARGLAGKSNTRSALMQVVAAQAIVVLATYFVTRDMTNAETDWQYEMALIRQRERSSPEELAQLAPSFRAMRRWAPPGWLAFRTLASALIIVALTRPRSREFFEAAARPLPDRSA